MGHICVAEYGRHRVLLFDAGGRPLRVLGDTMGPNDSQFNLPYHVQFLHSPHSQHSAAASANPTNSTSPIMVADYFNRRLSLWSGDGHQHLTNIALNAKVRGLTVDMNGLVLAACEGPACLLTLEPRSGFQIVDTLMMRDDARPTGLCVDENNMLVVVDYWQGCVRFYHD